MTFLAGCGISFAAGFHLRDRRAKAADAEAARRAAALDRQSQNLRQTIDGMQTAAAQRRRWGAQRRREDEDNDIADTENQIRFIAQAELRAVRPVNSEAVDVLYALEAWIAANRPGWRVSFEVGLGAFIKTAYDPEDRQQNAAFRSYNSKRIDFLLIDRRGKPTLAVEYHGTGHDLSADAADRMAVKRLALDRAGIALLEIPAKTTRADMLMLITDKLTAPLTSAP